MRIIILGLMPALAFAGESFTYQARIQDGSGDFVTGNHTLYVSIYDEIGDSSPAFSQQLGITAADGYFTATIGPVDHSVWADGDAWIGIALDAPTPELSRQPLLAVPYAARAGGVGTSTAACDTPNHGAMRVEGTRLQVCLSGNWIEIASGRPGMVETNPADSCAQIKSVDVTAPDGPYWIDGGGAFSAMQLYCDMTTLGGGWTYVGRGSNGSTQVNTAYGTVQTDPDVDVVWHLSAANINAISGPVPYESYVRVGVNGTDWTTNTPAAERDEIRIRREQQSFTFAGPMFDYDGWNGTGWTHAPNVGSSSDRGPAWEPGTGNYCCEYDGSGNISNCRLGPLNNEGQWSNSNTNQHLRCEADTNLHNGLVVFVR